MISINYSGRLGNNLIQNFVALILSNKFKEKISNPLNSVIFNNISFEEKSYKNKIIVNNHNFFEIYNLTNLNSDIILDDFFQTREVFNLFENYKNLIINNNEKKNNDLFVHVRLGDILSTSHLSKPSYANYGYYSDIISKIDFNNGFISSDSPSHQIVKDLIKNYNLNLYEDTPIDTLLFSSTFEYKVLSLGTFSWWIGYLGNQNNIFFPNPENYNKWHGDIFIFEKWNKI
jgi:hypothetical protein